MVRYLDDDGNVLTQPQAFRIGTADPNQATTQQTPAAATTPSPDLSANTGGLGASIAAGTSVGAKGDPNPGSATSAAFDPNAWVSQALQAAQSTDDPNYWVGKINADPNVQNAATRASALAYWQGLINQGNGALAVRNGTIPLRNDTSSAAVASGTSAVPPPNGNPQGYVSPPNGISGGDPAYMASLRAIIQSRLASDNAPVDPNDLQISAPLQAASDQASRATDQERTAEAEREYAQGGLNTNALNQTIQQSAERNATSLGTLRGTLVQQAYAAKQQDLQSLLSQAISAGDTESAQQIQAAIANLQAQLQREGYGVSLAENAATQNANTVNAVA